MGVCQRSFQHSVYKRTVDVLCSVANLEENLYEKQVTLIQIYHFNCVHVRSHSD